MDSQSLTELEEQAHLIRQAAAGDATALERLLGPYHERLAKTIRLRMDWRLRGRVDAEDILQETYLDAARRLSEYAANPSASFYLWLRGLAGIKMIDAMRHHLGARKRDAGLEVRLYRQALPEASSVSLAAQLLGHLTSPSHAAIRSEMQLKVQGALNAMDPIDREVLVLRHFEHLTNAETAELLEIGKSAASKRYIVAIKRLKEVLLDEPGFEDRF
jgi:RNA polymerase sigma-70 factor (ECF subfamily)